MGNYKRGTLHIPNYIRGQGVSRDFKPNSTYIMRATEAFIHNGGTIAKKEKVLGEPGDITPQFRNRSFIEGIK